MCIVSRDAVLRHSRICRLRKPQLVPEPQRRGKKRSACDNCAKSKLSCDATFPCETCLFNHRRCTYNRLSGFLAASKISQNCSDMRASDCQAEEPALQSTTTSLGNDIPSLIQKSENQTAIPFLRKYVDPDIKSLPEVFNRLSLTESERGNGEGARNTDSVRILVHAKPYFPKYSFAGLLYELSSSGFLVLLFHSLPTSLTNAQQALVQISIFMMTRNMTIPIARYSCLIAFIIFSLLHQNVMHNSLKNSPNFGLIFRQSL